MKSFQLVSLLMLVFTTGCASMDEVFKSEEVKPWQRNILAEDGMQLVPDSMDAYVDEHIYFSKEASKGGSGIGGGGCGCN